MIENEYNENQEGFTFKKLWEYIKKAMPYMLVCLIITIMMGVAVSATLSEIDKKGNEKVQAVFELAYAGADEGLSPKKEQLDIQKIKSVGRVSKVLKDLGFNFSEAEIQNAIVLSGYYSPAMRALIDALGGDEDKVLDLIDKIKLFPTQYIVNFNYKSVNGLTSQQAVAILESLLNLSKVNDFTLIEEQEYIGSINYDDPKITNLSNLDKLNFLKSESLKIKSYINSVREINMLNKSLLEASLVEAQKSIMDIEYYVYNKGAFVTESLTIDDQIARIQILIDNVQGEIVVNTGRVADQKESIDSLVDAAKIIVNDKGEIISGTYVTELYNQLYSKYSNLLDEKAQLANSISQRTAYKTILVNLKNSGFTAPSQEVLDTVNAKITMLLNTMKGIATQAENISDEQLLGSTSMYGMKIAMSPIHIYDAAFKPSWIKCILISAMVGILLGLIIAYPIDNVIKKKKLTKNNLSLEVVDAEIIRAEVKDNEKEDK